MLSVAKKLTPSFVLLMMPACGIPNEGQKAVSSWPTPAAAIEDYPVKIGSPYQINGITYTPADTPRYDEVGYASWYAEESGTTTANGERFDSNAITAAHRTLPLPSYVEITALDTGRTILVRVNDRGPFVQDRIIDMSRGAADQLGIDASGASPVRVRRVNPPEQERAALRSGKRAAERLETPKTLLAVLRKQLPAASKNRSIQSRPLVPPPIQSAAIAKSAPLATTQSSSDPFIVEQIRAPRTAQASEASISSGHGFVVQIAAMASKDRALDVARKSGAAAILVNGLWRVRYGPYPDRTSAQKGIHKAQAAGFTNARIMVND